MGQSAGAFPLSFSPAGSALGLGAGGAASADESEEARKKRLAGLAAAQRNITGALSPAGTSLFGLNLS
jgi:hypothetical protein